MLKNIFSCCNCSNKTKIDDIDLYPPTEKEKNYMQLNKSYAKSNNKMNITNIISNKIKLNLTTNSNNSPLFYNRNINKEILPKNLFQITNNKEKINNTKILILPNNKNKNKNNSKRSFSVIKMNNSYITNLLNETNTKNENTSEIKDIENRKKIILSGELFFGKKIIITPNGLNNNFIKRNERSTFFGIQNLYDFNGNSYNDYLINIPIKKEKNDITWDGGGGGAKGKDAGGKEIKKRVAEEKSTRVFKIIYDKENDEYKFIYLDQSLLLYFLIENKFILEKNKKYYFILNEILLSVSIRKDKSEKDKINIKIENDKKAEKYFFYQENTPIKIGRVNCNININLQSLSKLHCIIGYSNEYDYFYFQDNCSTNGSILLIKEDDIIPIKGVMNFILENTSFKIEEKEL